jgi:hypothetical protein
MKEAKEQLFIAVGRRAFDEAGSNPERLADRQKSRARAYPNGKAAQAIVPASAKSLFR